MNIYKIIKEEYKNILREIKTVDYILNKISDEYYKAWFISNEIKYFVNVWHDDRFHKIGEYEIEFGTNNQNNASDRVGKDIKHLNTVLYTVFDIVDEIREKYSVQKFYIDSASDHKDDKIDTLRGKIYYRFLKNKYPDNVIDHNYRFIRLNFTNKDNKNLSDKLINLLLKINNNDENIDGIKRGLTGVDGDNFTISTDYIDNNKHGLIYVDILVSKKRNLYELTLEYLDDDEVIEDNFDNFEDLYNFIEEKFSLK